MTSEFQDAALVLVGHGSTLNGDSAAPTLQHADELRRRALFAQVLTCFWKQEPMIAGVLRGAFAPRVFVVPLFISEGYFTEQVIPRELGFPGEASSHFPRVRRRPYPAGAGIPPGAPTQTVHYCGPIGTHESMTEALLSRARQTIEKYPFPRAPKPSATTLFIAGHGTGNNENSRKAIERQVELIREKNLYAAVHPVFMEEEPRVESCYATAATRHMVMVPFFISDGLHSFEDIPMMLGEPERVVRKRLAEGRPTWRNPTERHGKLLWYTPSIGNEAHIAEVILQRVREAAGQPAPE